MTMLRIKLEYLKKQRKFYTDKAQVWTFAAVAFFFFKSLYGFFIWLILMVTTLLQNIPNMINMNVRSAKKK